jgi:hypothetical protein
MAKTARFPTLRVSTLVMPFRAPALIAVATLLVAGCAPTPASGATSAGPEWSCLLAPASGNATRVEVTGSDAATTCKTIANLLGPGSWAILVEEPTGRPSFALPKGDTRTLCVGSFQNSNYTIVDDRRQDGTGDVACTELQEAAP